MTSTRKQANIGREATKKWILNNRVGGGQRKCVCVWEKEMEGTMFDAWRSLQGHGLFHVTLLLCVMTQFDTRCCCRSRISSSITKEEHHQVNGSIRKDVAWQIEIKEYALHYSEDESEQFCSRSQRRRDSLRQQVFILLYAQNQQTY